MRTTLTARRPTLALVALTLAASAAAGCANAPATQERDSGAAARIDSKDTDGLNGTLIDDPPLQIAHVTLRDTDGRPVDLANIPTGKATVLFFGFTHCDDVCPTTMADLTAAQRLLPKAIAQNVTIRFVTVDPDRDTPHVLRTWLNRFSPDISGLRGSPTLVNKAERSLYADESSTTAPGPTPTATDGHEHKHTTQDQVSHSGSVYIFGPDGRTVLYTGGTSPRQYAADLTRLLRRN